MITSVSTTRMLFHLPLRYLINRARQNKRKRMTSSSAIPPFPGFMEKNLFKVKEGIQDRIIEGIFIISSSPVIIAIPGSFLQFFRIITPGLHQSENMIVSICRHE